MPKVPRINTIFLESSPQPLHLPPAAMAARSRLRGRVRAGAAFGVLAFFAVALFPALIFGGTAGAQLALGLLGGKGSAPAGIAAFVGLGVLSAVIGGAVLFAAAGAALAAAVDALTRADRPGR